MKLSGNQYTSCLLCGSDSLKKIYGSDHFLVICMNCNLVFSGQEPTDEELTVFYSDYHVYDELSNLTLQRYRDILDKLEPFRQTNNLLESGCGYGFFLEEARKRKWKVYGTELSPKALEKCRMKNIFVSESLNDIKAKVNSPFDAVVSLEVIEHLKNPVKEMAEYSNVLRHDGALYITTPNFNSLSRRLLGEKWNVINYPEHLFYFTSQTIDRVMSKYKFKKVNSRSSGFSQGRIIQTMRTNKYGAENELSKFDYNERDRQLRDSIEKNSILRMIKNMINSLLSISGTGDTLKVLYQKKE